MYSFLEKFTSIFAFIETLFTVKTFSSEKVSVNEKIENIVAAKKIKIYSLFKDIKKFNK